jgi:hypothetical protein
VDRLLIRRCPLLFVDCCCPHGLSVGLALYLLSLVSLGLGFMRAGVGFSSDNYCKQTFEVNPTFIVM